ncbi:hypothetical protein [Rubellicoccus peritrichatus]|uniref:Uncharacterized protein n=1 Tax=Rubellicoccus peritrichatus TaxID=3080537 RepID=A0AAQ3QUL2_9BACT|nr:hypothetical protein [Puniceicoccus sp. CR14]WOO39857.1 hypothetical protein RZN69_14625 [Puniceicoccus sp. CR14]
MLAVLCGIGLLGASISRADTELAERFSENNLFQVIGFSYEAVQFTGQMADQCVNLGKDYLPIPLNPPQPVLVKLVPQEAANSETPYYLRSQVDGGVHVYIHWGEDTKFEDVCQALASGMLQRTAIWHYGHDAGAKVPDWFELAFGQLLATKIRAALIDQQREEALDSGCMPAVDIVGVEGPFGENIDSIALNSVWFFRFLQAQAKDMTMFRRVCTAFLADLEPISVLVKGYPDEFKSIQELELWWEVGFQATVRGRQTPFYSMQESRELIRRFAFITFQEDEVDVRVAVNDLRPYQEDDNYKVAVQNRLREVKIEIQKINPVYFNALLSLGVALEAANSVEESEYELGLEAFASDYSSAQKLELEIRRLLRW